MTPVCANCGRDIERKYAGGLLIHVHAATWQVLESHRVEPASQPARDLTPRTGPSDHGRTLAPAQGGISE
jgi:hypothetical protein